MRDQRPMNASSWGTALVIGGGTMGTGIAACLAVNGIETVLQIRRPAALAQTQREVARRIEQLAAADTAAHAPKISLAVLSGEVQGPFALAVESVSEDMGAKRQALTSAEALVCDDGIVATNTSCLPLADLAQDLARPERFAGWHWFNPAQLVRLVEIVGSARTLATVLQRLEALSWAIGKQPIVLRRDTAGFVANRLQYALLREAYALVEAGICSLEDVDRAVVAGLGARWAAVGPFASMDAAGLDVHETVVKRLFPQLSCSSVVPELLIQARQRGAMGIKGGSGLRGDYSSGAGDRLEARRDAILTMLARAVPPEEV